VEHSHKSDPIRKTLRQQLHRFYFTSTEEFNEQLSQARYEEVEIEYINGDNPRLLHATKINQCNVDLWFDELDRYEDDRQDALAICYLIEIMHLDEVILNREA
jgi:hypothetical protein